MGKHKEKVSGFIRDQVKASPPPFYNVILLNDDYTPMDFVVHVLMGIFQKSIEEATSIMLRVHNDGKAICGHYSKEIAETKLDEVEKISREMEYPLSGTIERA